ncbi:macrolide 2'-phosphotransferase [Sphingobacterium sp. PU5-4]|uniref:Macrolide 2'-phosphotransferase n=1 Tax=Sphingobacterium tenebrionis TaxID=3111775 RepID=A0ABU8I3J5_9SPHI
MIDQEIKHLAKEHGLALIDQIHFSEMGIDFRVGMAKDIQGKEWILRIPRRPEMLKQIQEEKNILSFVQPFLKVEIPDWVISTERLVAYPALKGKPVLTYDASYAVKWNMDQHNPHFVPSLAHTLYDLHQIPAEDAKKNHIKMMDAGDLRPEIDSRLTLVKSELGISEELESRYKAWLQQDALWPDFTSFIHGDLYAGHILTNQAGEITGIIDWTTAQFGDPSIDFSGHLNVFGEESLKELIQTYERLGGKTWDKLFEQTVERAAASALAYGYFAILTQDDTHIKGAKSLLGVL